MCLPSGTMKLLFLNVRTWMCLPLGIVWHNKIAMPQRFYLNGPAHEITVPKLLYHVVGMGLRRIRTAVPELLCLDVPSFRYIPATVSRAWNLNVPALGHIKTVVPRVNVCT